MSGPPNDIRRCTGSGSPPIQPDPTNRKLTRVEGLNRAYRIRSNRALENAYRPGAIGGRTAAGRDTGEALSLRLRSKSACIRQPVEGRAGSLRVS